MANIELPKDAEGREIPLDTKVLYDSDGIEFFTDKSMYMRVTDEWWFFGHFGSSVSTHRIAATRLHLTTPDSWEKLEEDLGRAAERSAVTSYCRYFNTTNRCVNCSIHNDDGCCTHKDERAFGDILDRIRKLRGEDE
ncbi:hypothetical protein DWY03_03135 [Collinsella sp. AF23-2]|jgi:hypothetical protein|uniref:hypothetical protein n=1 Tax=unclassified Collinsella TaxID=2637548 RepID=UPI000E4F08BD|nr:MULTISPECIES: hypothetical protein [unclassified Collinsella]RGS26654.1 hypothetical protein DWY04_02480 [Collinsella sp. AF23-3LB]RGS28179.1 hypothetical protein DWY03_03135 [Collinsella sp. AF23-2]